MSELTVHGDNLWHRGLARAVDRLTSERYFIPPVVLMETAGRGVAEVMARELQNLGRQGANPDAADFPRRILVLAGDGNNGGDALVAARHMVEMGHDLKIVLVTDEMGR